MKVKSSSRRDEFRLYMNLGVRAGEPLSVNA